MLDKFITGVFLIIIFSAYGQKDTAKIAEKLKSIDLLIIPYEPEMYINYEENDLIVSSGKTADQLNVFFRLNLDKIITAEFNKYCKASSLLSGFTHDTGDELFRIYAAGSYFYDKISKKNKNYTLFKTEDSNVAEQNPEHEPGELVSVVSTNADKFLNVRHDDKNILNETSKTYKNNLFLFITQFEIKGDYSNPYAVNSKTYTRRIKVHYSVFSPTGEFLHGGYSYCFFDANQNNIKEITEDFFNRIAEDIVKKVAFQI